ncbi:MAG: D-alanyl-D-alanine carboxypeptidase/D-alanyl-D-alanine-endopeptidase [Acidobacteriota bacterium]
MSRSPFARSLLTGLVLLGLAAAAPVAGPAPAGETGRGAALPEVLRRLVQEGALARSRLGIQVVDIDTGRVVFEHQPDLPLRPASNMKLATTAAALSLLGPEYIFKTEFYTAKRPSDHVVQGDLYIKGYGSPGLGGEQWWRMAREIRARGIRRVEGDLVGDATFFDARERPDGWPPPEEDAFYNAPISALSADYSAVTIIVRPTREGHHPEISLTPFSSYFKVVNHAVTRGRKTSLRVGRRFDGKQNIIVVDGNIPSSSRPDVSYRSVERPTLYALRAFREAASREGILIRGIDRKGRAPEGAYRVFVHRSRSLADLTRVMNKLSNNLTAESILKTLGTERAGPPGTTANGAAVLRSFLEGLQIDTSALAIHDGSGLSSKDRLTASSLTQLLRAVRRDFRIYPEFLSSLSIAGVDGTLKKRMKDGPAYRRIRAKTGHVAGVSSLSGYAYTRRGKVLAFAILANTPRSLSDRRVRREIDGFCAALVESPLPPAPAGSDACGGPSPGPHEGPAGPRAPVESRGETPVE